MLRQTVNWPSCLGVRHPSGTRYQILITTRQLSDWCGAPTLTKGQVCSLNCYWPSPAQSFSCLSAEGLMTIFYCLRFKIRPTFRARPPYLYPPGTGWLSYNPRNRVPFSSPPTTRRATVEELKTASTTSEEYAQIWICCSRYRCFVHVLESVWQMCLYSYISTCSICVHDWTSISFSKISQTYTRNRLQYH
jgi:hypothetical protein